VVIASGVTVGVLVEDTISGNVVKVEPVRQLPPLLFTMTVTEYCPANVGVPEIIPVALFNTNPEGKL
jgi:hypothetical protein